MPIDTCEHCGGDYHWKWEEAFEKFGFNDGDGQVETTSVEQVLKEAGYEVESHPLGIHNVVIDSIKKDGKELMPIDEPSVTIGYDEPREYLSKEIVELLDRELGE